MVVGTVGIVVGVVVGRIVVVVVVGVVMVFVGRGQTDRYSVLVVVGVERDESEKRQVALQRYGLWGEGEGAIHHHRHLQLLIIKIKRKNEREELTIKK